MLCEKCKTAEATVHITEVVADAPDEMKKRDLCEACFNQSGFATKLSGKPADWTSSGPGFTTAMWRNNEPER
jgi:protein-arginine kinase activator protein McsA